MNSTFKILPLLSLIVLSLSACRDNNNGGTFYGELMISGNISGQQPLVLYFEELTPTEIIPLDTIKTDADGFFQFEWYVDNSGFYRIGLNQNDFITIALEPNQKIYLTAQSDDFRNSYKIEGSEGSELLWKINQKHLKGLQVTDSLRMAYREARFTGDYLETREELKSAFNSLKDIFREFLLNIVEENPRNLASILALHHFFEDEVLLNEEDHFYHFEKLSKSLCSIYPGNKHVINLKKRVNDFKRNEEQKRRNEESLAIGKPAPEITLPDPMGSPISLSSLQGNIVLIDFWAAWCPPCREANVLLKELYNKYHASGFEIYGISLDRNRQHWIDAIRKDNITWKQVSDLRFMNSPVVSLYNVAEVPHYVLIDREGKIISRNFSIDELEALLKENL